jgi:hypothetical protein
MTPDEFRRAQDEAMANGGSVPVGDLVLCDFCDEDLTTDSRSGGFMFSSMAAGPCCAAEKEKSIRGYREERFITARCPEGVSFADWVRAMRGPNAAFKVTRLHGGGAR